MNLNTPQDEYCERLDATLFSEPINFLTNLAFFIAAWYSHRLIVQKCTPEQREKYWFTKVLVAEIFLVGLGSFTYHSVATVWAKWVDIIPIIIFLFSFLFFYFRYLLELDWTKVALGLLSFATLTALLMLAIPSKLVNNSDFYFGTCITIFLLGIPFYKNNKSAAYSFFASSFTFSLSLLFRSIDYAVCSTFPLGTHFLWHLFNGLTIYLAMHGAVSIMTASKKR